MSDLIQVQNKFQNYLLQDDADFTKLIISTEKVAAEKRLAIYSNAYRSRLHECLVSNYPILNSYLGAEFFEKMAIEYINQYPSTYRSIRWYGDQLSSFLTNHTLYNEFPYIAELAHFEWNMTLVFDAADDTLLKFTGLTQIPPEDWNNMRLQAHPSVHRLNCSWNIVQIWQDIADEKIPPEPVQHPSPIPWILWRKELINRFCSLTADEAWAIDAVISGLTFGEICEGLCQWVDEQNVGIHAASLLKGWIQSGLLAKVN